jgi:hypothetical protein
MTDVAELDITPLHLDVVVELLKLGDGLFLLIQILSSFVKLSRVLLPLLFVLARPLHLQLNNLPGVEVGEHPVVTDADLDLIEAPQEATESINSNVLAKCTGPLELIHPLNLLAENVAVTNTENLRAGLAMLVATFMEEEADATLGIIHLPLRGSDVHSESSSEMTTDMDGGVIVADNTQKGCVGTNIDYYYFPYFPFTFLMIL